MNTESHSRRYIFVTGGVLSGVGKGITAASLGAVLKARGLKVSIQKCDPYLNVDAGTLNPAEHGECFVTKDGAETDLDLGHYERFLDIEVTRNASTLAGRLLQDLIADERAGKFLGKTVQLVPHLTNAIQSAIELSGGATDVHIVEIGGTVGDYEGLAFIEAIREFAARVGRDNCLFVHVVYIPYLGASKEFKTKPAQNAVRDLRSFGITPDVLVARTETEPPRSVATKLSLFSGVEEKAVIVLPNADTIYRVPLTLQEKSIDDLLLQKLRLEAKPADMAAWQTLVNNATKPKSATLKIGIIAKYLDNEDTYFSVIEALRAAAWQQNVALQCDWVNAEAIETDGSAALEQYDTLLVPGGFGTRGVEGKVAAAAYALENNVPYLGICLGLQVAVIAAARKGGLHQATSEEIEPGAEQNVIYIMKDQKGKEATGGTMRLGDYPCVIVPGTLAEQLHGSTKIIERHRHRYEVNRAFEEAIVAGGLRISGTSPDGALVEMIEAAQHPYFIATQAHPEFSSRPHRPYALFSGLIKAGLQRKQGNL
ncbi:MAG TPA: CTP synthase [Verrucomicrobiae bacterium]|nr:CTP synthase [Verrucomicrobiae bacterium]